MDRWTRAEIEILRTNSTYKNWKTTREIMELLPNRNFHMITGKRYALGLTQRNALYRSEFDRPDTTSGNSFIMISNQIYTELHKLKQFRECLRGRGTFNDVIRDLLRDRETLKDFINEV